jgi:hypothetical protein
MHFLVAAGTKGYQIGFDVIAQLAPRLNVVNFQTTDASARLATPAVSFQDLAAE